MSFNPLAPEVISLVIFSAVIGALISEPFGTFLAYLALRFFTRRNLGDPKKEKEDWLIKVNSVAFDAARMATENIVSWLEPKLKEITDQDIALDDSELDKISAKIAEKFSLQDETGARIPLPMLIDKNTREINSVKMTLLSKKGAAARQEVAAMTEAIAGDSVNVEIEPELYLAGKQLHMKDDQIAAWTAVLKKRFPQMFPQSQTQQANPYAPVLPR